MASGEELGSGRFVLLHDPAGNTAWQGTFRCVTFARADVDPEMVTDPLLAECRLVLADRRAGEPRRRVRCAERHSDVGVQRLLRWDGDEPPRAEIEVRASWTRSCLPMECGLSPHLAAGLNYSVR